jgi:CPA1 family monovalent cation:H+ antiporter
LTEAFYTAAALLGIVAAVEWLAGRLHVPPPILLVVVGIVLAVVPGLPAVELEPEFAMQVLLPPLIYFASFSMSWQAFRANLRPILLLAVGCVVATTLAVAAAGHWLLAMPLGVAFMLGAIVSPPDVVAPLAIAERLPIPRRITSILEGEGLVNDATALILFNMALVAVSTGGFSPAWAAGNFVLVLAGETVWGLLIGFIVLHLRDLAREPRIEVMLSLLTPFLAFWPPHATGGSGVLATVVAGMYTGYAGVRLIRSNTRLQAVFFWDIVNTVITGAIFLLTGLQARAVANSLDGIPLWQLIVQGLVVSGVVIGVRFAWVYPGVYLPRWLSRRMREREPRPDWRLPFLVSFTGVRGVVSLAAALSIPVALAPALGFSVRDRVLVLTFVVIVVTLVAQGLTLPWVIRALHLVPIGEREQRERRRSELGARIEVVRAGLARLEAAAHDRNIAREVLDAWRRRHLQRIAQLEAARDPHGADYPSARNLREVELSMIAAQRQRLNALLHEGRISDSIRRRIERDLDLDEERLRRNVRGIAGEDPQEADLPPRE